jgi:hypothetical protein
MSGCLYRLVFPNGKAYIGITSRTAARRFAEHCKSAACGRKLAVNDAIRKYGAASVTVETLVVAEWPYLVALEPRAIAAFGTRGRGGYNMTTGGEGVAGLPVSDQTRAKLRAAQTGKKLSDETREKMRAASRARIITDDLREKFRTANLGRQKSPESIEKTRLAHVGKKLSAAQIDQLRARSTGRAKTPAEIEKLRAANVGRTMTADHRMNLSLAAKGRTMSKESIEKQWATRRAKAAAQ